MRVLTVSTVLLLVAGCATANGPGERRHATSADDPRELLAANEAAADARAETDRARRWAARKELCRNLNVRFDRSTRCW